MRKQTKPNRNNASKPAKRHSHARRRLLQSLTIGGAAVTVKQLPEQWSRPVLDTAMLPAHSETTMPVAVSLTCEVDGPSQVDSSAGFNVQPATVGESWLRGGTQGTVIVGIDDNQTSTFEFLGLEATLMPPDAGPVTLDVNSGGTGMSVNQGANQTVPPNAGGTARFDLVQAEFNAGNNTIGDSGSLTFNYAASGEDCVINVTFIEVAPFPP